MSFQWNSILPVWLTLLLAGCLFAAVVYNVLTMLKKQVPRKWMRTLAGLRLAILIVFVLILLQPTVSLTRPATQLPEFLVLVDVSQSMDKQAGHDTRLEQVKADLRVGPLAKALRSRFDLRWFSFDSTATLLNESDLTGLKPKGSSTDYSESILAACNHVRALGKNPRRLLLVGDGNDLGTNDPVEIARRFGLTIDVLAPRSANPIPDPAMQIIEVQGPRRVLIGSETRFRVTMSSKQPAMRDRNVTLSIAENGKKILEQNVLLNAGRTEVSAMLAHRPSVAGLQQYEFRLSESSKPYQLPVQVVDSKYEVLILEDTWRWEYKYLHRLFEDDPSFRYSALLARSGGTFMQFAALDRRINLIGFPQNRSDLEAFDAFVIGDVNPARWPRGLARALAQQIADEGKSLVVIAGPNVARLLDIPELHNVLPVELTRDSGTPVEGPIEVRFAPDARNSPFFFQIENVPKDGTANESANALPALDQIYPVLRKRAGANVLLEAVQKRNAYGNFIVIAEHTVGRGRVLFVATDTLWKWQTLAPGNEGSTPHSIFWQQSFRAMTPARTQSQAVNLWLSTNRSRSEVGRAVMVLAEIQSGRAVPHAGLQAIVTLPDNTSVPLVFHNDPTNPKLFLAEFTAAQAGAHRFAASLAADGKTLADGSAVLLVEEPWNERNDHGIDHANLSRIAQATGGQVLDTANPESWPSPAEASLGTLPQIRTFDLWNNFSLMLILCALLGADWFIRLFKCLIC